MPPALFPRSIQVARLLKGLQRIGWASTVVTLDENSRANTGPTDPMLSELYAGCYQTEPVVPTATTEGLRATWLQPRLRTLTPLDAHWALDAAAAARRVAKRKPTDVLVTFAQPWRDHFVGLVFHRPRLPWIAHFSDPWVDSLYYNDMPDSERRRDLSREGDVIKHADLVVFTNQYAADLVMSKYPDAWRSKTRVVAHAMDADLLPMVERLRQPPSTGRTPLRLAYVGALLVGRRTIDDLLAAMTMLDRRIGIRGRIEFTVVGSGSGTGEATAKVAQLALEPLVSFRPQVTYLESLAAMRDSDALVLIDAPARTNVFLPSKLVDYLLADRPILGITPAVGASADLVRSSGSPLAEPGDIAAIADAIETLLHRHEEGKPAPVAPDAVRRQYSLDTAATAFAGVLEEAVAGSWWRRRWL